MENLKQIIEKIWDNRELLQDKTNVEAIESVIELLDKGKLRIADRNGEDWQVNDWVKKAVILYFPTRKMEKWESGILEFHDKIPLKKDFDKQGIRVVPHAVARYGSYIAPGVILMPSYVNI